MTIPYGRVVLFTGPTSAGKSTCAAAWAGARTKPTAHFDHDQARFLLRSGYVSRSAAHANPSLADEADRQWMLSIAVCEVVAETYALSGYDIALSAFRPPGSWRNCWERLDKLDPLIIVLLPTLETLLIRDTERTGRSHTGETSIHRALNYDWEAWRSDQRALVIDNSALSVDAVVAQVEVEFTRRGSNGQLF
jgi:chloramphenicol 3-O-phosphotransferase